MLTRSLGDLSSKPASFAGAVWSSLQEGHAYPGCWASSADWEGQAVKARLTAIAGPGGTRGVLIKGRGAVGSQLVLWHHRRCQSKWIGLKQDVKTDLTMAPRFWVSLLLISRTSSPVLAVCDQKTRGLSRPKKGDPSGIRTRIEPSLISKTRRG